MKQPQYATIFNGYNAANSGNSETLKINPGIIQGSIHLVTNASFNGTTSTAALQGSNDDTNWATIYEDDGVTAMTFTLATNNNYIYELKRVLYKYYRIVYTKGDANAGTLVANFYGA